MAKNLNLKLLGLYTHPNPMSEMPIGSLSVADNVVITRESLVSVRRGFKQYNSLVSAGSPPSTVDAMFEYNDDLLTHHDSTISYDNNIGGWVPYSGIFEHPDNEHKIRGLAANQNFYFNSATGVYKIDDITLEPVAGGAPRGLGMTASLITATGWFQPDTAVAYRVVWGYTDKNKNLILGTPSQRVVITNPTVDSQEVLLDITIPDGVDENWLYFLYRSNPSSSAITVPDDELQLVYEDNPTTADITSRSVIVTDSTLNELKGAALYTNQSQQSILQTNDRPPYCKDMAVFKNHVFFANTRTQHRFELSLIAVGGSLGLNIGDTVTVNGVVYTAAALEDVALNNFFLDETGTPSQNIDTTAISLIRVVNKSASNTDVYAYYLSGFEDIPGKILFESRIVGGLSFAMNSSIQTCWAPRIPVSGTASSSDNEVKTNRIYISKRDQPEAVPLLNFVDVGSANDPINRVIALRDSLMVLKDDGIFRLTGSTLPFTVYPFNDSVEIKGLETAKILDNRIFMMSDQGVVAIGDSGVEIISRAIEKDLIKYTAPQYNSFRSTSFALSYESERLYVLFLPTEEEDSSPTQAYVYNTITDSWTRWDIASSAGIVKEDNDRIYLADVSSQVREERKTLTRADYAEEEFDFNITLATIDSVNVLVDSTIGLAEGQTIRQVNGASDVQVIIDSIIDATQLTVVAPVSFQINPAIAYNPIPIKVEWNIIYGDDPMEMKHFRDTLFVFEDASFVSLDCTISSNFFTSSPFEIIPLRNQSSGYADLFWGLPEFGIGPWGGDEPDKVGANLIRTLVPVDSQRAFWLKISLEMSEAYNTFALAGISLQYTTTGNRIR